MASEEIDSNEQKVIGANQNGTTQITIPKDWRPFIGLSKKDITVELCTVALVRGKHGYFVAVYNKKYQRK